MPGKTSEPDHAVPVIKTAKSESGPGPHRRCRHPSSQDTVTAASTRKRPFTYIIKVCPVEAAETEPNSSRSVTSTMMSRTNLKQQLMRQQLQQIEKKEAQHKIFATSAPARSSSAIKVPANIPLPVELPRQVLMVQTKLENPTPYHVKQSQQRQVLTYLSHTQPGRVVDSISSPPPGNSCDPSPNANSPLSVAPSSSAATSPSELDEFWDAFKNLEPGGVDTDLNNLESTLNLPNTVPSHQSLCLPVSHQFTEEANILDVYSLVPQSKSSSSCPAELTAEVKEEWDSLTDLDFQALTKDRQKKDNHNMIERKRRYNINDRIKELGTLLPKTNDPYFDLVKDIRHNKGTILKATVDYVRCLKKEAFRIPQLEDKCRQTEIVNRKLLLRIQELELQLKKNGICISQSTWHPSSESDLQALVKHESLSHGVTICSAPSNAHPSSGHSICKEKLSKSNCTSNTHSNDVISTHNPLLYLNVKQEIITSPSASPSSCINSVPQYNNFDDLMEDDRLVTGDPMFSSHDSFSPENMDFMT